MQFENCEDNGESKLLSWSTFPSWFWSHSCITKTVHLLCDSPNSDFTILCLAIEVTGLGEAFDTDGLTIFAPSDDAFENLGVDTVQEILLERRLLEHLLLFHVVTDVLEFDDLHCREPIRMANGEDSRTVCAGKNVFQKGAENSRSMMPEIVQENVETCQGFVHVVGKWSSFWYILVDFRELKPDPDDFQTKCSYLEAPGSFLRRRRQREGPHQHLLGGPHWHLLGTRRLLQSTLFPPLSPLQVPSVVKLLVSLFQ